MSENETLQYFEKAGDLLALHQPYPMAAAVAQWSELRGGLARSVPEGFSRDEWAYIIAFLDANSLLRGCRREFGTVVSKPGRLPRFVLRPREPVALWLPNNVVLLGPLMIILASLTGARMRVKTGSKKDDLTLLFVAHIRTFLSEGPLATYFGERLTVEDFSREDPRNLAMAADAKLRVVFGSDEAAQGINRLPQPPDSLQISFCDHYSEAWVMPALLDDPAGITTLARVFAVFGQAGCTSPARVVIIGGEREHCRALRAALQKFWQSPSTVAPAMAVASQNVSTWQIARASGRDSSLVGPNAAVLSLSGLEEARIPGLMHLDITFGSLAMAADGLESKIQTIGHAGMDEAMLLRVLETLTPRNVKRFVPLSQMHHFGPVWDGFALWRHLFEEMECVAR